MAAAWTLAIGLTAVPAQAQITLEAKAGFSDVVQLGRWAPVEAQIDNAGEAQKAEVYARVRRGSPGRDTEYVQKIELPARARRGAQFVLPLLGTDHPIQMGVRDEAGHVLAERTLDLQDYRTTEAIVLALSREVDLEFLPPLLQRKTAVAYPRPDQLPTQWAGLDAVRAVVVHGVSLSELEQTRYEALRDWVAGGGILIFAGGASYSLLQGEREQELLPVTVKGLAQVNQMPVLRNYASQAMPKGNWLMIDSVLRVGEVLAEAEGRPLIASRPFGLGTIFFLAIDYASPRLTSWPGNLAIWDLMLSLERKAGNLDSLSDELDVKGERNPVAELLRQPLLHYPSRTLLLTFLLAYAVLLLVLIRGTGAAGLRGALSWAGLAVLIAGGLSASLALREPILDADAAVLALKTQQIHPGFDSGRVIEHASVFSSRGGKVDLSVSDPRMVMRLLAQYGNEQLPEHSAALRIEREGSLSLWDDLVLPRFSAAVLTLESVSKSPVAIDMKRGLGVTALRIENHSDQPIAYMAVLHRGVYHALGGLEGGATRVEDFFDATMRAGETVDFVANVFEWNLPPRIGGLAQAVPLTMIRRQFGSRIVGDLREKVLFVAWLPGDDPGIHVRNGNGAEFALTLVIAEIPL